MKRAIPIKVKIAKVIVVAEDKWSPAPSPACASLLIGTHWVHLFFKLSGLEYPSSQTHCPFSQWLYKIEHWTLLQESSEAKHFFLITGLRVIRG